MSETDIRRKVWELCQTDIGHAERLALGIGFDWYRCQSLAAVAIHTSGKRRFMKLANEALDAARRLPDPNRKVTCSAWIISVMAKRPDVVVDEMLSTISAEENAVRRADALFALYNAVYPRRETAKKVFESLLATTEAMRSWKQPLMLGEIALVLARDDPQQARAILDLIANAAAKRKTEKAIASKQRLGPYEFLPYYSKVTEAHPVR
jgi:hypothetical protein